MRLNQFCAALMMGCVLSGLAAGQPPPEPDPPFAAEQKAAGETQMQAEKLLAAGERGPDSEPCRLMASYYLHTVKAAAAAGARTRIADWPDLTPAEQEVVMQAVRGTYARNRRLRQVACTDAAR